MSKISIIKNIQLGKKSFAIENPDAALCFSFYCGDGEIQHNAVISFEKSNLLSSLIETGQLTNLDLIQNNIDKQLNRGNQNGLLYCRYQICNFKECNNNYLIIFDINEYRDYYSCFIYSVLQID
ncbi:hypothetical protein [Flavobacterium sp. KACC 22761]|uniref:hypothetical protein n=1 Tax=Flavobacterium sp. KACC 22761 TaxID=3092665 RepID=UPI002A7594A0|nr:hypothetical protein [Flavobacterium sp. KACC 22761]WPO77475.1 hypothetical protein SCB73_14495 [Flavobacterium sp. KACC 22761]